MWAPLWRVEPRAFTSYAARSSLDYIYSIPQHINTARCLLDDTTLVFALCLHYYLLFGDLLIYYYHLSEYGITLLNVLYDEPNRQKMTPVSHGND